MSCPTGVLLLESIFHHGGAETITFQIAKELDRDRFDLAVVTLYECGPIGCKFQKNGFPVYSQLMKHKWDFRVLFHIRRIIQRHNVQVIYLISQPLTLLWGLLISTFFHLRVVAAVHNTMEPEASIRYWLTRQLLLRTDCIVAVSERQKQHLESRLSIKGRKIRVIRNGVDSLKFVEGANIPRKREELHIGADAQVVGIVARIVKVKAIDVFLRAAVLICMECTDVEFVVVGEGPEMEANRQLAKELGLSPRVKFLGRRSDVPEIVPIFDVALLTSRSEALPISVLEYMAAGRAIVATDVGSLRELITDGVNGLLVPRDDPVAIARAVVKVLKQEGLGRQLGSRAREAAVKQFDIRCTVEDTETLLEEMVRSC